MLGSRPTDAARTGTHRALIDDIFLPEPTPREVRYTVISVDDHVVEPAHAFAGRVPAKFAEAAPRVVEIEGTQQWLFDGKLCDLTGIGTTAGLKDGFGGFKVERFEQMRRGCYDVDARIADMDVNGVWGSLNFPTHLPGFAGRKFAACSDPELGLAVVRAWNDWVYEEWYSVRPDRIIGCGITFLADPQAAANEIRRNAERGFTAVSLLERPHMIGLPSLFSGYWDPVVRACHETNTVINLHIGSSGVYEPPADARDPIGLISTMFGQLSIAACVEWLFSGYPERFPELAIAASEGGIGWVAMLLDRLDNLVDRSGYGVETFTELRPADLLKRNFRFCTLDDPSTIDTRHRIGVDHIMAEVDYPHGDGTWPDTQSVIERYWGHLPSDELRKICSENAARLYRLPLPDIVLPR
jgi:predicted TIM-barrel fold metal-dependent hydrolase